MSVQADVCQSPSAVAPEGSDFVIDYPLKSYDSFVASYIAVFVKDPLRFTQ